MSFSTIVDNTIVSPTRQNYDLTISGNSTVSSAYATAGITDKVGLQVVIWNGSGSAITLTAGAQFNNYTSFPEYCLTNNQVIVPINGSVTLITTIIGQDYTISSMTALDNIDGGAAGNLIYQTNVNRTGFLAAGTSGYVLEGAGIGNPPVWNVLTTGALSGGVAGSLVYQSAPSTTAKTAAGTAFGNTGGGIAGMINSTTPGWIQTNLVGGLGSSVYSGGNLTLHSPRAYTITTQTINSGTSGNLYTWMNANISQYDGDIYTVYNNSSSNYNLTIQNTENPNGWGSLISSFAGGANVITLYPNETVNFQRYNSTYLTIISTTQNLGLSGQYNGVKPAGTASSAVNLQWTAAYDPQGWLTSGGGGYEVIPTVAGNYFVWATLSFNGYGSSWNPNIQILKNNNTASPISATIETRALQASNHSINISGVVTLNGTTDWVSLYVQSGWANTGNFTSAQMTVTLLN